MAEAMLSDFIDVAPGGQDNFMTKGME